MKWLRECLAEYARPPLPTGCGGCAGVIASPIALTGHAALRRTAAGPQPDNGAALRRSTVEADRAAGELGAVEVATVKDHAGEIEVQAPPGPRLRPASSPADTSWCSPG